MPDESTPAELEADAGDAPAESVIARLVTRWWSLWGGAYAVVERDFLVTTSTWRFLAMRLSVALVAVVVVAVVAIANQGSLPDEVGRNVFGAAVVVVPMLLFLVAPATAAPAISSEREGGTLGLVLAAPVSPLTFVLAKFTARFLSISVLVFAMLPVAATCFLFGGVPFETFLALVVFSLTVTAFCVSSGLTFSAFLRSPAPAVLGAFLFVLLAPLVPMAVLALLDESGIQITNDTYELVAPIVPFYAWSMLGNAAFSGQLAPTECWIHAGVMAVVTALLLGIAVWRMKREGRVSRTAQRTRTAGGIFLGRPLLDRGVRGSLLWHPRKRGFVIPALAVIGEGLLLWGAIANNDLDEEWVHIAALGSLTILAMLRMLTTTASAIASERSRGSLDVLMTAPYSPSQLGISVLAGALLSTSPLFALGLVHGTLAAAFGVLHPLGLVAWSLVSAVLLALAGAVGLRASVTAGSPTKSALLAFGAFFGPMVLALLLAFLLAMVSRGGDAAGVLLLCLPLVQAYYVPWMAHAIATDQWYRHDRLEQTLPLGAPWLYALAVVALVIWSVRILEERRG